MIAGLSYFSADVQTSAEIEGLSLKRLVLRQFITQKTSATAAALALRFRAKNICCSHYNFGQKNLLA
ncbi:hypothetical protein [Lysinibacillus sp. JNUCC 51]|uniref:hypothetical protein n=1 Tax=Lysinibacillus sp. JNUCC-51 TaxID=2792479 RepID=UPI0019377D17|nr:hypothetical protein JNUCC51_20940 [Lysinibacillus sp. JNUCC-51]